MMNTLINGMENAKLKKLVKIMTLSAFLLIVGMGTASANENDSQESSEAQQSKIRITGTVVDANGEPVIGANVIEKGVATNGIITDTDGKFILSVSPGATLVVSYLGYVTQQIAVGNRAQVQITLQEDLQALEEVVVIGYGTQTKKSLTAAVSTMDMSSIEANTHSTVSHALQGKAAGLRVVQVSAQPGGASSFRIRGETSINAGNDPLFVVDGMPISPSKSPESAQQFFKDGETDNFLESLNPDDIESISVLKDAASTAIYGARAGHGVILITTKRGGKSQKTRLNYSGNYSFQTMDKNYLMLNPQQYMQVANMQEYEQYLVLNGLDIYRDYIAPSSLVPFMPRYSPSDIANASGTDWFKEVTRTGVLHQHNLSLSGGTESTRYLTSVNYMNQDGIIKNSAASRFAARINLDHDISKYLTVGVTANYAQNIYDNIPMGTGMNEYSGVIMSAYQANPLNPIYDSDGSFYIDPRRPQVDNPVALLEIEDITHKERLIASGYVTIKPLEGLSLKAMFGGDKKINRRSNYTPKTTLNGAFTNGSAYKSSSNATDYLMELTATYNKTIGDHKFNVLGGYSFQKFTSESVYASNKDFLFDSFSYHNLGAGAWARPDVGSGYSLGSIYSWFARAHYNFNDRYLIEGSIRADGSSNFTKENSVGVFPAVSAGWVISEEAFMESTKSWLSSVKLRASYGQTGNESIGRHVLDYYTIGGKNTRLGLSEIIGESVFTSELGNTNLTWETTTEMNIGIDAGFLNNRIRLSAEYFDRRVSNLLTTRSLPSHNEVKSIYDNIGETGSKGVEVTINSVNLASKNFEWTSTLTLSHHEDRWIQHFPGWVAAPYEGTSDPIRANFGYRSLGLLQPGQAPPAAQPILLPGGIVVADLNNDGVINDYDKQYLGNTDPGLIYGLNNAVRYMFNKKYILDFNIYFYGESGLLKWGSYKRGDVYTTSGGQNATTGAFDSFRHDNLDSTHPGIWSKSTEWGDHYVHSVFFARCGSITLGCTLPVTKFVEKVRVYFDVTNPFIITNHEGLDPETEGSSDSAYSNVKGTSGSAYPNVKSFNVGINLNF